MPSIFDLVFGCDTQFKIHFQLENKEEIIKIQKDSIKMTQAELKDLHQKMLEKVRLSFSLSKIYSIHSNIIIVLTQKGFEEKLYQSDKNIENSVIVIFYKSSHV